RGTRSAGNIGRARSRALQGGDHSPEQVAAPAARPSPDVEGPFPKVPRRQPAQVLEQFCIPSRGEIFERGRRRNGEVERELLHFHGNGPAPVTVKFVLPTEGSFHAPLRRTQSTQRFFGAVTSPSVALSYPRYRA